MILYNFAEMMTSHVVISQMDKRHPYQVNFTVAVHVCRHFLRSQGDGPPPNVEALIRNNTLPIRSIRPGQKNTRKIRLFAVRFFPDLQQKTNGTGLFPMPLRITFLFPVLSLCLT
jgi:hypothetical protein